MLPLTRKLVVLMLLATPSHSADLASLHLGQSPIQTRGSGISSLYFSQAGKPLTDYYFASFLVETLYLYRHITAPLRKGINQLFLDIVKPRNPVTPCTIA